jgi:hypothetical protein
MLQPVAHGLLQCREEADSVLRGLRSDQLWSRPGGAAAIAYHIRHAIGSLDRLFTYARGEPLSDPQLANLAAEGREDHGSSSVEELAAEFREAVDRALHQLRATDQSTLLEARSVGRAKLPSTVQGLLFPRGRAYAAACRTSGDDGEGRHRQRYVKMISPPAAIS